MNIRYRRDIDGLRSIAVGSVVLFHSGFKFLSGGFVGVDIFFVISGYLISIGLFKEMESGKISIARFYERRVRRILPAYSAVILASLLAGYALLLPSEFMDLARSSIFSSVFSANLYFWKGAGYFAGVPLSYPLLHMWSLSVEEQFYLVWPVALILISARNLNRFILPLILVLIFTTLLASELMIDYSSKTAFYMAPLRAWELLVGALLARVRWPELPGAWAAHALGGLGLAMMLIPIFLYAETSHFPGLLAVPPCLGAALIIYRDARYPSFVARLLETRPAVFIGKISYSLYLWHWPILSYFWYQVQRDPTTGESFALLVPILIVSTLSWRFIEQPFRAGSAVSTKIGKLAAGLVSSTGATLRFGVVSLSVLALLGGGVVLAEGLPQRLPAEAAKLDGVAREPYLVKHGCVFRDSVPENAVERCFAQADDLAPAKVVVWGDSFAGVQVDTLQRLLTKPGQDVISVVATGCAPLPGAIQHFGMGRKDERCNRFNTEVLEELLRRDDIRQVVMVGRWSNLYGMGLGDTNFVPSARILTNSQFTDRTLKNSLAVLEASLNDSVGRLIADGKRVAIIEEGPRYAEQVRPCVARAIWRGQDVAECGVTKAEQRRFRGPLADVFSRLGAGNPEVKIFDPLENLCGETMCDGYDGGVLLTYDNDHLTRAGTRRADVGLLELINGAPKAD